MKCKHVAYFGVTALLLSQLLLVECNKERGGKKEREGAGNEKQRGAAKGEKKQAGAGQGSLQGRFVSKDKAECIWSVTEAETVTLRVECIRGESRFSCTFGGKPSSCPKYAANQKSYWKQITRAVKKQKNICQDPKAVLKSKECKKGPQAAHLSYISSSLLAAEEKGTNYGEVSHSANPTAKANLIEPNKECVEDVDTPDKKRVAQEYCGETWSSFCNFFFSMVQSKRC
ncbi:hypothetical protein FKM82_001596 [Ascaphus truei]|uniref:fibroblast growth factor-binding protein 1 n=1 Tax=Ascaphus truei TaxID=8439 RepID=UPI003F5A9721